MTTKNEKFIEDHIVYDDKGAKWRIIDIKKMKGSIKNSFNTWTLARTWIRNHMVWN